ncbi:MAG: SAM-dependent methyltransferase [Opitutaceae bacterium]|nr:SAM-dependent methyltransferase [Opitutaceae bacterium]
MTTSPPEQFLTLLGESAHAGTLVKFTFGKPRSPDKTLLLLLGRPIILRGQPRLSLVWRHEQRDIIKNYPFAEAVALLAPLLGTDFYSAHLFTANGRVTQLEFNKKGMPRLTFGRAGKVAAPPPGHNRTRTRVLPAESQRWLVQLGVTTPTGAVREGMADKHRQIHKFVELLSHLVAGSGLPADRPLAIADMGCGKGYLTFAVYDYFNRVLMRPVQVRGIETRADLVKLCNRVAHDTGCEGLVFVEGSIAQTSFDQLDLLIALHACDTATDDAIAKGIAARAGLIVVAPCCQKELRPQLRPAPVLIPALRHGIFQERQAEFATDALRALLLEWAGYETKVSEFISTEHTAKNLMITAVKRPHPADQAAIANRIRHFAAFYGIQSHALARHLGFALDATPAP